MEVVKSGRDMQEAIQKMVRIFWHSEPRLISSILRDKQHILSLKNHLNIVVGKENPLAVLLCYHSRLNTCDLCRPTITRAFEDLQTQILSIFSDSSTPPSFKIISTFHQPCQIQSDRRTKEYVPFDPNQKPYLIWEEILLPAALQYPKMFISSLQS